MFEKRTNNRMNFFWMRAIFVTLLLRLFFVSFVPLYQKCVASSTWCLKIKYSRWMLNKNEIYWQIDDKRMNTRGKIQYTNFLRCWQSSTSLCHYEKKTRHSRSVRDEWFSLYCVQIFANKFFVLLHNKVEEKKTTHNLSGSQNSKHSNISIALIPTEPFSVKFHSIKAKSK